jgi:hypothetical protein
MELVRTQFHGSMIFHIAGTKTSITVTWQPEIYPQVTRKCPIWQTRNLDFSYAKTALVALNLGQGEAMYRDEVPTGAAVHNLESKHADAERLSSPRG